MDAILEIANRRGLLIIEDCALAVGARYRGTHVGLLGDVGIFSFYPVKHITTGDGGMFVSRHADLAASVAQARAFGVDRTFGERKIPGIYDVASLGLNYRMSDINSAIGRQQLRKIDTILQRRHDNFQVLRAQLAGVECISIIQADGPLVSSGNYCLSMVLEGRFSSRRNDVVKALNAGGIGTSVYYPHPVPRLAYYRGKYGYEPDCFRCAARISDRSIALPVGPHLNQEEMFRMKATVADILAEMPC